jgi:hypothetical protein
MINAKFSRVRILAGNTSNCESQYGAHLAPPRLKLERTHQDGRFDFLAFDIPVCLIHCCIGDFCSVCVTFSSQRCSMAHIATSQSHSAKDQWALQGAFPWQLGALVFCVLRVRRRST